MADAVLRAGSGVCNSQTVVISILGEYMFEGIFQPMHLLVIFGIALLVFGPKKLPELGKGIGEGIRGLRSAMKDQDDPAGKITNPPSSSST